MKDFVDEFEITDRTASCKDADSGLGMGVWLLPMALAGAVFWVALFVALLR